MIKSVRIKHFKAIKDSGRLKLGPLSVFVGHNGTGKSSIIEALEFFTTYATRGLDSAIEPWYDAAHIWWQGAERKPLPNSPFYSLPMEIQISGHEAGGKAFRSWSAETKFSQLSEDSGNTKSGAFVAREEVFRAGGRFLRRRRFGEEAVQNDARNAPKFRPPAPDESLFRVDPKPSWGSWQFLSLDPFRIAAPRPRSHLLDLGMERSGANLGRYLKLFLDRDPDGYLAMIDSLRYILPYAVGLEPELTRDLINQLSFFRLVEGLSWGGHVKLPGWVLSGGTLRILAILTALRHPIPPPVLFVEELENGLDPRALGFIVEEIRHATQSGRTQVIATTHSPYLLDKLALDHLITVDRKASGPPVFTRATENPELNAWSKRFAPGSLYTMGMFRGKGGQP